ncbi:amidohydrolase [Clostridium sp. 'deep sea']|uniref:amidohydrolase n=1 Tax=Clostridium sp. 'deep sea' TaxID=2779445 RepID=UPI0018965094|nr:amidohydrolase [Clostridium sp. 'deep sea']QOR35981.1 amidohydrolase [Clostridium sp. 'deep sea']
MLAIVNGKLLTITNGIIENGTLILEDGKIKEVGDNSLSVPSNAKIIDAKGNWVTPGFIDAHAHIGIFGEPYIPATADGNEKTGPIQAEIRGIDSLNPNDIAFPQVLQAGVTTVYTGPGSSNIIGGTGFAMKTVGNTVYDMVIPGTEAMKFALGENPKRNYKERKQLPSTRMGNAACLRMAFIKAQNYMNKIEQAKKDNKPLPERDLSLEAIAKVLKRELKARIHCHRADDIVTAIRIAEEFKIDFTLEHCTEGYHVADLIAKKQIPCVIGPLLMGPAKQELWDVRMTTPAVMHKAGVKIAIMVDASSTTKYLPIQTGLAVRYGLPEEEAFKAITINAAEIIGLQDKLGSLDKGKEADVVIWDGHPLSNFTSTKKVIVAGKVVFSRDN